MSGKYGVIRIDPPRSYRHAGGRGAALNHYQTQSVDFLKSLDIAGLADKNAACFLWGTFPTTEEDYFVSFEKQKAVARNIMRAWGFQLKTIGFLWVKLNKDGSIFKGMGAYTRANAEPCWLGIKGKMPVADHTISQIVMARRREHSRKPKEVDELIKRLYPGVAMVDCFAREHVEGWDQMYSDQGDMFDAAA